MSEETFCYKFKFIFLKHLSFYLCSHYWILGAVHELSRFLRLIVSRATSTFSHICTRKVFNSSWRLTFIGLTERYMIHGQSECEFRTASRNDKFWHLSHEATSQSVPLGVFLLRLYVYLRCRLIRCCNNTINSSPADDNEIHGKTSDFCFLLWNHLINF